MQQSLIYPELLHKITFKRSLEKEKSNYRKEESHWSRQTNEITIEEENYLVHGIQYFESIGWQIEPRHILKIIKTFLDVHGGACWFKNNLSGRDWVQSFLKRHKDAISRRKPEYVTVVTVKGLTETVLDAFFDLLGAFVSDLAEQGTTLEATQYHNPDETGLSLNPKTKNCLFSNGSKAMCITPGEGKLMYTVLFCSNAAGDYLPPYIIFKKSGKNFSNSWIAGAPTGKSFNATTSGWMEDYAMQALFQLYFISI